MTTANNDASGIVYILTNEAMPGYIKIGKTGGDSAEDVQDRMRGLDGTGVPRPFDCVYAAVVADRHVVEKKLHTIFERDRVRPTREFFEGVPVHSAKAALELAAEREVTPGVTPEIDDQGEQVPVKPPKRPPLKFSMVGLSPGTELTFFKDESITCTVRDDRLVDYQGELIALSPLSQKLLGYRNVGGADYWLYQGETLSERRRRLENEEAEKADSN